MAELGEAPPPELQAQSNANQSNQRKTTGLFFIYTKIFVIV